MFGTAILKMKHTFENGTTNKSLGRLLLPLTFFYKPWKTRKELCNLHFETESKLSDHNYDTHVNVVQANFDDGKKYMLKVKKTTFSHPFFLLESIIIEKNSDKFQFPKFESKIKTPTTFKRHMEKHNGVLQCIPKKKRQYSELESMNDEYPSNALNHHTLENEEVNLQVDTSCRGFKVLNN